MRVHYRARRAKSREVVYEKVGVTFCCDGMRERWGALVGFGVRGHRRTTDRAVNLQVPTPRVNGGAILELVPIDCCPWCGEPVELVRRK